jgi:hypothetical protein
MLSHDIFISVTVRPKERGRRVNLTLPVDSTSPGSRSLAIYCHGAGHHSATWVADRQGRVHCPRNTSAGPIASLLPHVSRCSASTFWLQAPHFNMYHFHHLHLSPCTMDKGDDVLANYGQGASDFIYY